MGLKGGNICGENKQFRAPGNSFCLAHDANGIEFPEKMLRDTGDFSVRKKRQKTALRRLASFQRIETSR